jgi:glutamine synthetase
MSTICNYLNKDRNSITKKDIIRYIKENDVKVINFRYIAGDGRLKTLNFSALDLKYVDRILSFGERVDGSSLFKNIDSASSDLYVIPRYSTVYENPFSPIKAIDIICNFFDKEGNLFELSPDVTLLNAQEKFRKLTGYEIKLFGELEYYVIAPKNDLYPIAAQKGYHESFPFNKWENLRVEAMHIIQSVGGKVKYAHSEVGFIRTEDKEMSQNEIEFLPEEPLYAAYQLIIAKWILNSLGFKYGVTITFSPKISIGHAGSGLHIHSMILKDGKNVMLDEKGNLSSEAKKLISGLIKIAKPSTAFGNTIPISYLRLVPHQEAPVRVCWGYRNRSALIRVPLGWNLDKDLSSQINPVEKTSKNKSVQTVEFRAGDGSANISLYIASLICGAIEGFLMKDSEKFCDEYFVDTNIFNSENKKIREKFESLPSSCYESSIELEKNREIFEKNSVFSPQLIDSTIRRLQSYNDKNLSERLYGKEEEIKKLVEEYLYC